MTRKLNCPELEIQYMSPDESRMQLRTTEETSIDLLEFHAESIASLEDESVTYLKDLGHEELVVKLEEKVIYCPIFLLNVPI